MKIDFNIRKPLRILWIAAKEFYTDRSMETAAAMSFYVLFSLFPLLICLVWIIGTFLGDHPMLRVQLIKGLLRLIPMEGSGNVVFDAIEAIALEGKTTGIVGLLMMTWSGTAMFRMLRDALNEILNVTKTRSYLTQRVIDIILMIGLGVFFFLSITITALLQSAPALVARFEWIRQLPLAKQFGGNAAIFWQILSSLVAVLLSAIAFFVIYSVVPAIRKPAKEVIISAIFAAVLFEFLKSGFAWYVKSVANYDLVFGSLATVIAFLFWVYLASIILLFGAQLLAAHPERKQAVI